MRVVGIIPELPPHCWSNDLAHSFIRLWEENRFGPEWMPSVVDGVRHTRMGFGGWWREPSVPYHSRGPTVRMGRSRKATKRWRWLTATCPPYLMPRGKRLKGRLIHPVMSCTVEALEGRPR